MNRPILRFAVFTALFAFTPSFAAAPNILFVGNSFTHGQYAPLQGYNSSGITDTNNSGYGGIPGVFQKMATGLGYSCNVSIEAVSSINLAYHYANKSSIIGQAKWNYVVLQDYSTEPTNDTNDNPSGYNIAAFNTAVGQLQTLILNKNANAKILLYETWARPGICSLPSGWGGFFTGTAPYYGMTSMLNQLHTNYYAAASTYGLAGVDPVGDAFQNAISVTPPGATQPCAHTNIFDGPIDSTSDLKFSNGQFSLWYFNSTTNPEAYHPSIYGGYLSAAVHIAEITGLDPRNIPTGTGSAAAGLGISSTDAGYLNYIAYISTAVAPTITNGPAPITGTVGTAYNFSYATSALPTATMVNLASGSLPPGVTLSSAGLLSGTPTLAGIYSGTISASNGFGSAAMQNFSINVSGSYNQWAAYYGVGATTATPQGDGVSNLIKYLCDIAPNRAMTASDLTALPTAGSATNGGNTYLTLTYRQNASATGLQVTVQSSTDLMNWGPANSTSQTISTDPVTHDPIIQVKVDVTGQPREFVRLNVITS